MLKWKSLLCGLQALLLLVSQLSVYNYGLKRKVDRAALELTSVSDCSFAPIDAEALQVSAEERDRCRAWYDAHIRSADSPAYDLTVGMRSLQNHPRDWEIDVGAESAPDAEHGGKATLVSLRHKRSGLRAEVEATIYEAYAACEWTVRLQNTAETRSPVIHNFYAADCTLETGQADVYYSKGSVPAADDFALQCSKVCPSPMIFNATCGRTESFLPFFNLCGKTAGAVVAVGWTGQWYASLRQTLRGVRLRVKQEQFFAALEPGEAVRSPQVSLTFYDGANALKGFETFRQMLLYCVYPASVQPMRSLIFANEFCTLTCDELIEQVNAIPADVLDATDTLWMDAGWYAYQTGWYDGVGNWTADPARFPDGLRPLADAIETKGKRFLLWYEPERVRKGTRLYETGKLHDGWIIEEDDNLLWNLANDEACDVLADVIADSLLENGVRVYRQDFNFYPLSYWHQADQASGFRLGISENHYVTNLYRFLDTLAARVPGLIIDNCASGGKRLDLEMCRRSVPLWRSDYNCVDADGTRKADVLEATQAMTHGLSFWLPYNGTVQHIESLYAARSSLLTHPMRMSSEPFEDAAGEDLRGHMTENYFPLTCGGTDSSRTLAMQFGNERAGAAVIYVRKDAPNAFLLRLNGLRKDGVYTLADADDPAFRVRETGERLMETGVTLTAREQPAALIITYSIDEPS